jgi:hypothetical protein
MHSKRNDERLRSEKAELNFKRLMKTEEVPAREDLGTSLLMKDVDVNAKSYKDKLEQKRWALTFQQEREARKLEALRQFQIEKQSMDRAVENYQSHERLLKVMRAKRQIEYKR